MRIYRVRLAVGGADDVDPNALRQAVEAAVAVSTAREVLEKALEKVTGGWGVVTLELEPGELVVTPVA